jgi:hypothetical protein
VTGLLFPRYWLAVISHDPLRLVLASDGLQFTVDGPSRIVHNAEKKVLATFESLKAVDVVHREADRAQGVPEHWTLDLYLGRSLRVTIGRSRKHADVTQAAARIAKLAGKPVRTLDANQLSGF